MIRRLLSIMLLCILVSILTLNAYAFEAYVTNTFPLDGSNNIGLDPKLFIEFTQDIEFVEGINKSDFVTLISNEGPYGFVPNSITKDATNNKRLLIDLLDERDGVSNLRKDTNYTLTVKANLLNLIGTDGDGLKNQEIIINFTTTSNGYVPSLVKISSNVDKTDDLTLYNNSNLSSDGNVFVHFDTKVQIDKSAFIDPNINIKLNKILKPETVTSRVYSESINFIKEEDSFSYTSTVDYEDTPILNTTEDHLIINPVNNLDENAAYKIVIDKGLVEDLNGINTSSTINKIIYTAKRSDSETLNYSLKNGETDFTKTYNTQPVYGPDKPIQINISKEVIPTLEHQTFLGNNITKAATLSNIEIYEENNPSIKSSIKNIVIGYQVDGSEKKSKIFIYPEEPLKNGTHYKLKIPEGTFESLGGVKNTEIVYSYITALNTAGEKGINSIENSQIKVMDLKESNQQFSIIGYNFNDSINKVMLVPYSGNASESIDISNEYIEFHDSTKLIVHIKDHVRQTLANDISTGKYRVKVIFNTENNSEIISQDSTLLTILPKDKPLVIDSNPKDNETYDENEIKHEISDETTKDRYFVKIEFTDIDGTLNLNEDKLNIIQIHSINGIENMLDRVFINTVKENHEKINKYIFTKDESNNKAILFIPILKLSPNNTYVIKVPEKLVYYGSGDNIIGNETSSITFNTKDIPNIDKISIGTVPEGYKDYEIYIEGRYFSEDVEVYFNDEKSRYVTKVNDNKIKVKLPRGLDEGIYDIIVKNGDNHKAISYGSISIIQKGKYVPNDKYEIKKRSYFGDVKSDLKINKDTLEVMGIYDKLELNLDELMGYDTYLRNIRYYQNYLPLLDTKSIHGDVSLLGIRKINSGLDVNMYIGRINSLKLENLKKKLRGKTILAEPIGVYGSNFKLNNVIVKIPFKGNNFKNIKVLRYDEQLRRFYEEKFSVNVLTRRIELISSHEGIFFVVKK